MFLSRRSAFLSAIGALFFKSNSSPSKAVVPSITEGYTIVPCLHVLDRDLFYYEADISGWSLAAKNCLRSMLECADTHVLGFYDNMREEDLDHYVVFRGSEAKVNQCLAHIETTFNAVPGQLHLTDGETPRYLSEDSITTAQYITEMAPLDRYCNELEV